MMLFLFRLTFYPYRVIVLLSWMQGSLVYGGHGQLIYRAKLDVDICKEVVIYNMSASYFPSCTFIRNFSAVLAPLRSKF